MQSDPTPTTGNTTRRGIVRLAILCGLLAAVTALAVAADLDRRLASLFYQPVSGWYLADAQPWRALYHAGTVPGLLLTLVSLAGVAGGFYLPRLRPWRRPLAIVLLTSVIGAGILVNAVLKPYWGRPRPSETVTFGGVWEHHAPHQPGTPGRGKSFPCGHCTMGYLFVSLLAIRRQAPRTAAAGAVFGVVLGTMLGVGRMVQGSHFATDVLWSLGVILLVFITLESFVFPAAARRLENRRPLPAARRRGLLAAALLAAVLILAGFLTRRPFYETYNHRLPLTAATRELAVDAGQPLTGRQTRWADGPDAFFRAHVQGFGWVKARLEARTRLLPDDARGTLRVVHRLHAQGYFAELGQRVEVILPRRLKGRVTVRFEEPGAERPAGSE